LTNKNAYKDNAFYQRSIKNPDFIKKVVELAKKADILDNEKQEDKKK
jgi:hypothetical protein